MSYLALYREFRPTDFETLIGQEHVVQTLVNQIKSDRVGHAYLFCGARGTGKTTAAKVFAKAINCLSPKNGSPCGECEVCKKLADPANLDIIEMDAASNNKVENVRDLRDKVQYPPVAGKYKVYIVDEVHMLTAEAFNALLKTLEEPPEHAVFILATTEVQKLPSTILSRCMRFDFKLIPTDRIADYICKIYDKVGKKYQKEAVDLIARAGEGSMRDALSVADVCVSYSEGELTYDDVLEVLGASDKGEIQKMLESMLCGNPGDVLTRVETLCGKGKSVGVLNSDVCSSLRDLLIIKTCEKAQKLLGLPNDKFLQLKSLAEKCDEHGILRAIEIFSAAEADLKYSTHPRVVFETAALKAALPAHDYNIDALISRINALEKRVGELSCGALSSPEPLVNSSFSKEKSLTENAADKKAVSTAAQKSEAMPASSNADLLGLKSAEIKQEDQSYGYDYPSPPPEEPPAEFYGFEQEQNPVYKPVNGSFVNERSDFAADVPIEKTAAKKQKTASGVKLGGENLSDSNMLSSAGANASANACAGTGAPTAVDTVDGALDTRKAWGMVLRKLRDDKEIMLWVACQDVGVRAVKNLLFVIAGGANEYNLLVKPNNLQKLADCVMAACGLQTRVVKTEEEVVVEDGGSDGGVDSGAADGLSADNSLGLSSESTNNANSASEERAVKNFFGEENVQIND